MSGKKRIGNFLGGAFSAVGKPVLTMFLSFFSAALLSSTACAAPAITAVSGTPVFLNLSGSGFGTKATPAPAYWENLEAQGLAQLPSDQITNIAKFGTTQGNKAYSGNNSVEFDYSVDSTVGQNDWRRNAIDLGTGVNQVYVTAWVYLDKTGSTSTSWQWKGFPTITSSPQLYYDLSNSYPAAGAGSYNYEQTAAFASAWYFNNSNWSNPAANLYYYDTTALASKSGVTTTTLPSDAFLFGQWQRLEYYAQRSSSAGTGDGIWMGQRIGKSAPLWKYTNAITHQAGNNQWRYVVLSHAVESVYNGVVNLTVYMDDIYVDTTQARVELCDTATWAARTHCEVQPASAWTDNKVSINVNRGGFNRGDVAYLYVVDGTGAQNSNGYIYKIGAPLPPKNIGSN